MTEHEHEIVGPDTQWLRATPASRSEESQRIGVDREARVLRGYVVAQAGPFKDRRGEFDEQALTDVVRLMRLNKFGTKSRFTHPNLSDDGLGKFLGRAKSPRLDQVRTADGKTVSAVRADLHFSATAGEGNPHGNLAEYVMRLAEEDADAMSSSLVLQVKQEHRLEPDGTRKKDAAGTPLPPLWRPQSIHASDIVDTGDAVDGLLAASLGPEFAAELDLLPDGIVRQATALIDQQFPGADRAELEARLTRFLARYLDYRFGQTPPDEHDPRTSPERTEDGLRLRRLRRLLAG